MQNKAKLFSFFLALGLILLIFPERLLGAPELSRVLLRMGTSPKLKAFSPAQFSCFVSNPDTVPHLISVRITPKSIFFEGTAFNVYTDSFYVPAACTYEYNSIVIIENSEEYSLAAFSDGVALSKLEESMVIKLASPKSYNLGLLNDSSEFGFGSLVNFPELKDKYNICFFTYSTFPSTATLFEKFAAIIISDVDFERLSAAQIQSLFDYVTNGGTIIFGNPKSVLQAKNSPLGQLLPVIPFRIRKTDKIGEGAAFKRLFPEFKGIIERTDFLESVVAERAYVQIEDNGMPLIAIKKCGLGYAKLITIPLSETVLKDKNDWLNFVKFLLFQQELFNEQKEFSSVLDEMTGFSVPKTSQIVKYVLAYIAVVSALLSCGRFFKRQALSWGACVLVSLFFTFAIILRAGASVKEKGGIVSGIELCIHGDISESVTSYYGLFSSKNEVLTIKAPNASSLVSAIMPKDNVAVPFMQGGANPVGDRRSFFGTDTQNLRASQSADDKTPKLIVQRNNGIQELSNMSLPALRGKQFRNSFTTGKVFSGKGLAMPEILYGRKGFQIKNWKVPDGISVEASFVAFPDGAIPINYADSGYLGYNYEGLGKEHVFSTDTLTKKTIEAVIVGAKHPSPALAIIEKLEKPSISISEPFKCQGSKIHFFPLEEKFSDDEILLLPQQIVFVAGDGSSRNFVSGNRLILEQNSAVLLNEITIEFQIPSVFKGFELAEATIVFRYDNPGANIAAKPYLLAASPTNKISTYASENKNQKSGSGNSKKSNFTAQQMLSERIPGNQSANGVFVFSGANISQALDTLSGRGKIVIEAKEKNQILDPLQKRRANAWSINELSISMKLKKAKIEEVPDDQN